MLYKLCFSLTLLLLVLPAQAQVPFSFEESASKNVYTPLPDEVKRDLVRNIQKRYVDTSYEQRQARRKMANRILRKAQQRQDYEMVERFQLELNVIDYFDAKEANKP